MTHPDDDALVDLATGEPVDADVSRARHGVPPVLRRGRLAA